MAEKRPPNTLYFLDEMISNDKDIKYLTLFIRQGCKLNPH